jgi:ferredoxin
MGYEDFSVYFMTGTGNTYRTALRMAEVAGDREIPSRIFPIEEGTPKKEMMKGERHLLGLMMPTHGFTAPWAMIRFALRLPPGNGTHAFVTPTRAGLKFGRVFTPGMEGTAGYLIALILFIKGYNIRGVAGLDMPSNWISVHPGLKPRSVAKIVQRAKLKCTRFMETIATGDRWFCIGSFVQLFFGLLLLPISAGYLLLGRFYFAKLFFADYRCTGCGICVDNCPNQAVRMSGKENPRPYWTFSCENCMRCMGYCPNKAVEAGHSLGLLLYFVTAIPFGAFILHKLSHVLTGIPDLSNTWVTNLVQYPYMLLSMYLCYLLITSLIRIPLINRAFTWTTFTRIWRRYHEPETMLKDLRVQDKQGTERGQM